MARARSWTVWSALAMLWLALTGACALAADATVTATDGRVVGDDVRTRFVLDISAEVAINAFTLDDPYRVVVDLPEIDFQLPQNSGAAGRGLVERWRYGLFAAGRSALHAGKKRYMTGQRPGAAYGSGAQAEGAL